MTWNREKAVDYFMGQYNKYDPEQYKFRPNVQELHGVYDTELALQRLYMECASAAAERETLLTKLSQLAKYGANDMRAHNLAEYKGIIKLEASEIKRKIEINLLSF
jgi:hypothetical protein